MNSSTAPVYQSESAPSEIRGTLLTLQGTMTILGLCIGMASLSDIEGILADWIFYSILAGLWNQFHGFIVAMALSPCIPGCVCCLSGFAGHRTPRNTQMAHEERSI